MWKGAQNGLALATLHEECVNEVGPTLFHRLLPVEVVFVHQLDATTLQHSLRGSRFACHLQTQIEKAEAHIKHLDNLLTNPARPLSKQTEARYITQLAEAETALENLQKKQEVQREREDPERIIPNFYYVLSHLLTEYRKLSSEHQKRMIRKVIVIKEH